MLCLPRSKKEEVWGDDTVEGMRCRSYDYCRAEPCGCCSSSKEKVIVPTQSTTPTLGKELEDLEKAYKNGTITKEEYETGKKNLLDKGTQPSK